MALSRLFAARLEGGGGGRRSSVVRHPVAHSADSHHNGRVLRIDLDLGAQALNVDIDQARVGGVLIAPHLLQKLLATENPPGLARQGHQELELQGCERNQLLPAVDLVAGDVNIQVAGAHVLIDPAIGVAPQSSAHPGQQLLGLKGLVT